MVLKITANFSDIQKIMESLKQFNFTFYNGSLYVSNVKCKSKKQFRNYIASMFTDGSYIQEIVYDNLKYESVKMQDWCRKQLVWSDLIKYEQDHQKQLQDAMKKLDKIEELIFDENGGDADG